jgi:hypothetical protein
MTALLQRTRSCGAPSGATDSAGSPKHIETSGQIARIGRLMEGYGEASYDYRLLM